VPETIRLDLRRLESWMQAVLVHPGSAAAGVVSREAAKLVRPELVEDIVVPTPALTGVERLGIYQEMYLLRMSEALGSDYPALARHLGEHAFRHLVSDYVAAHPSRSYTLNRLGDHLPDFLKTWGPARWRPVRSDLARVEQAISRVFDAAEESAISSSDLRALASDTLAALRIAPVHAFAVLEVRSRVLALLDESGEESAAPKTWVLLYRRLFAVQRQSLAPAAGRLLSALAAGKTVGEAVKGILRTGRGTPPPGQITAWFREWASLGLFRGIHPN
jgi:hypothetical protein